MYMGKPEYPWGMNDDDVFRKLADRVTILLTDVAGDRFPMLSFTIGRNEAGTKVDVRGGGITVAEFGPEDSEKSDADLRSALSDGMNILGTGLPPRFREPNVM